MAQCVYPIASLLTFEFVSLHVWVQYVTVLLYLWIWGRFGFGFDSGCLGFELFA